MITKIYMDQVASFVAPATLETSKPVNLIYGLNGSGKTTISKYLGDSSDESFKHCHYEPADSDDFTFRVYNQAFIEDVFYNQDTQKGIFTLSKQNKDAEQKIAEAKRQQTVLQGEAEKIIESAETNQKAIDHLIAETRDVCFKIKQDHTGGDRILDEAEFLKGYKTKTSLLQHLLGITKSDESKDINEIKREVELLNSSGSEGMPILPTVQSSQDLGLIESNPIFQEIIVGQSNSSLSGLIDHLKNSDWFSNGLDYLDESGDKCPFCQQAIDDALRKEIIGYIDAAYKDKTKDLEDLQTSYEEFGSTFPNWSDYAESAFIDNIDAAKSSLDAIAATVSANIQLISKKRQTPSQEIVLKKTAALISKFNALVDSANKKIEAHNKRIADKKSALDGLKKDFWQAQRNEYDTTIQSYSSSLKALEKTKLDTEKLLEDKRNAYKVRTHIIKEQQQQTVNIDDTIDNINNLLSDCGLIGFEIVKQGDRFYRISREPDDSDEKVFTSLSEGEKTMISFFYFLELCRGKEDPGDTKEKIVVIDDPISSLSHMYVFNIAQLIKREFTDAKLIKCDGDQPDRAELKNKDKYRQCFILTHSLYFFYEMTETKHEVRKITQNLFRVTKGTSGSRIQPMKYEEIQNDYQSYWSIIRDRDAHPAIMANGMRNIIEYFFNFIEKEDLNNIFRKEELKGVKYQSFYRYINRESHSIGQNIFDSKEFDYQIFQDAFRLVFETTGYPDHYKKMMRL